MLGNRPGKRPKGVLSPTVTTNELWARMQRQRATQADADDRVLVEVAATAEAVAAQSTPVLSPRSLASAVDPSFPLIYGLERHVEPPADASDGATHVGAIQYEDNPMRRKVQRPPPTSSNSATTSPSTAPTTTTATTTTPREHILKQKLLQLSMTGEGRDGLLRLIDSLTRELADLIESLQASLADKDVNLEGLEAQVGHLTTLCETKDAVMEASRRDKQQLRALVAEKDGALHDINAQLQDLVDHVAEVGDAVTRKDAAILELRHELAAQETALRQLEGSMVAAQLTLKERELCHAAEFDALTAQNATEQQRTTELTAKMLSLTAAVAERDNQVVGLLCEVAALEGALDERDQQVAEAVAMQEELGRLGADRDKHLAEVAAVTSTLTEHVRRIEELQVQMSELTERDAASRATVATQKQENKVLAARLSEAMHAGAKSEQLYAELTGSLVSTQRTVVDLSQEVERAKRVEVQKDTIIAGLEHALAAAEDESRALFAKQEMQTEEQRRAMAALTEQIRAMARENEAAEEAVEAGNVQLASARDELQAARRQAQEDAAESAEQLVALRLQAASLTAQSLVSEARVSELEGLLTAAEARAKDEALGWHARLDEASARAQALTVAKEATARELADARAQVLVLEADCAAQAARADGLTAWQASTDQELVRLRAQGQEDADRLAALHKKLLDQRARADTADAANDRLTAFVGRLQEDADASAAELQALRVAMTALESEKNVLAGEARKVPALETRTVRHSK